MHSIPSGPRLLVLGASEREVCGVKDHAQVLASALGAEGAEIATQWWQRGREGFDVWLDAVEAEVARSRPDWILWHYTPVIFGIRGFPVHALRLGRMLAGLGIPVALVVHEHAFPFGPGWRRTLQAAAQRAALPFVLGACRVAFVTVEQRIPLLDRPWLPDRPLVFLPVFSNIPAAATRRANGSEIVGVFGYAHGVTLAGEVAGATARLRGTHRELRVLLLGAPGPDSSEGETWSRAFAGTGCEDVLSFTGVLDPSDLATAIAGIEVGLFADPAGPASRRGTLAAALGAGKPVVAVDGPDRWHDLVGASAVVPVEPHALALADALELLLDEPERRREQAERALAFYERHAAPPVAAKAVLASLGKHGQPPFLLE